MSEKEDIQNKIIQLYIDKFKKYEGGLNLCSPLIPRISDEFLKNRIVVVGQETNTWYNPHRDELKSVFVNNIDNIQEIKNQCLNKRYDHFIKNTANIYGGKFWTFTRLLYKEEIIPGEMVTDFYLSHCWINFFAVESCESKKDHNGRPTKNFNLRNQVLELQGNLLAQILKLLKPKLIIFLTGPSLDWFLMSKVLQVKSYKFSTVDENEILSERVLGRLKILDQNHFLNDVTMIRAYHPTYFMSRINVQKKMNEKIVGKNMFQSNASYYTDTLIKVLKKT